MFEASERGDGRGRSGNGAKGFRKRNGEEGEGSEIDNQDHRDSEGGGGEVPAV